MPRKGRPSDAEYVRRGAIHTTLSCKRPNVKLVICRQHELRLFGSDGWNRNDRLPVIVNCGIGSATQEVKVQGTLMPSTAAVLDYSGHRGGRRYEAWLEGVCRNFCRIDAESVVEDQIDWQVGITHVAGVAIAKVGGTSARFLRTRN